MPDPKPTPDKKTGRIMASVYLQSSSGQSLLQAGRKALKNPGLYLPEAETVEIAQAELERLGFTIEGRGLTLSISGTVELFETVCNTEITVEEIRLSNNNAAGPQSRKIYRSALPVMQIESLESWIEGIMLASPGVSFI